VYWPLTEMLRAESGILDVDTAPQVRAKLTERLGPLLAGQEDETQVERRLAPIARLLGAEAAADEALIEQEDGQSARESFFGAVRAVLEALAQERPLLLAWEDIHWADEGTLDLIEYLSQWLRAPVLQVALARDELLERRPSWSTLRRVTTTTFLEPLAPAEVRELGPSYRAANPEGVRRWVALENPGPMPKVATRNRITFAMLEAAAAGIPVVSTDVGACRELLEGSQPADRALGASGLVTGLADPGATAQAILSLARDAGLREEMGRAARNRVRAHYQESDLIRRYREIYADMIGSQAR